MTHPSDVHNPVKYRTVADLVAELNGYDPTSPVMYGLMGNESGLRPLIEYDAYFSTTNQDQREPAPGQVNPVIVYFTVSSSDDVIIDPPQKR